MKVAVRERETERDQQRADRDQQIEREFKSKRGKRCTEWQRR